MAYTSHGHHIPDTDPSEGKTGVIARCGGPGLCSTCSIEASSTLAMLRAEQANLRAESINGNSNETKEHRTLAGDIRRSLNYHTVENESGTPDFILAHYLLQCLNAFQEATKSRAEWRGETVELPSLSRIQPKRAHE